VERGGKGEWPGEAEKQHLGGEHRGREAQRVNGKGRKSGE